MYYIYVQYVYTQCPEKVFVHHRIRVISTLINLVREY